MKYAIVSVEIAQAEFMNIEVLWNFDSEAQTVEYFEEKNYQQRDTGHFWSGGTFHFPVKIEDGRLYRLNGTELVDGWENYFQFDIDKNKWHIMDSENNVFR